MELKQAREECILYYMSEVQQLSAVHIERTQTVVNIEQLILHMIR